MPTWVTTAYSSLVPAWSSAQHPVYCPSDNPVCYVKISAECWCSLYSLLFHFLVFYFILKFGIFINKTLRLSPTGIYDAFCSYLPPALLHPLSPSLLPTLPTFMSFLSLYNPRSLVRTVCTDVAAGLFACSRRWTFF